MILECINGLGPLRKPASRGVALPQTDRKAEVSMDTPTPIGIAGLGRMGAAIARRLLAEGLPVVVWNRTAPKAHALRDAGAAVAESPAELAARCPVVISMLFDADAADDVYLGPDGLFAGQPRGGLFIDMSTIGPAAALRLADAAARLGADFVECPVGGSVGPAAEGKLLGLAGGSDAALARARPVLDRLCRKIVHAGPVGAGARLKLAVNLPLLVYWQALGEALDLAAGTGLDGAEAIALMADTSGTPQGMKMRLDSFLAAMRDDAEMPVTFELRGALKDLSAMVDAGRAEGLSLPVSAAAQAAYAQASADGAGAGDATLMSLRPWRAARGARTAKDRP